MEGGSQDIWFLQRPALQSSRLVTRPPGRLRGVCLGLCHLDDPLRGGVSLSEAPALQLSRSPGTPDPAKSHRRIKAAGPPGNRSPTRPHTGPTGGERVPVPDGPAGRTPQTPPPQGEGPLPSTEGGPGSRAARRPSWGRGAFSGQKGRPACWVDGGGRGGEGRWELGLVPDPLPESGGQETR